MKFGIASASLAAASLLIAGCSAPADEASETAAQAPEAEPSFVAADFEVPTLVEAEGFKIVPLGPDLAGVDYAAYMSSIEHLQTTFTRTTNWPTEGITAEDAMKDMENEAGRFEARTSFAYAILTPDGSRERGCIYVYPSPAAGYDASVTMWVTKAEYDAGFDEEFYAWAQGWIAEEWPFEKVAYPGRAIDWDTWDALTGEE